MRALVAGGAGFIGSHLCERLLQLGWQVVCVDNLITGKVENLQHLARQDLDLITCDVSQTPDLRADLILHFASPASPPVYRRMPVDTLACNSLGTLRLLQIAARNDARFVFASTSEVYGDPLEHPQRETYRGNVDPVGPRSCYDEGKRFGEAMTLAMHEQEGVHAAIVRIFNTYGPRMSLLDGRVIPSLFEAALNGRPMVIRGDGLQTRSFCYVDDLVDGVLAVALAQEEDCEVYNLGNPLETTIVDLACLVSRIVGVETNIRFEAKEPQDPARRRPDISKVESRFGWRPRVILEEGLACTAAYFRQRLCAHSQP